MNGDSTIKLLLNEFPNLKPIYDEDSDYYQNLSYIVYADIFVPYIIEMVNKNQCDELTKIFNFIETLVKSDDEYISALAVVGILELLLPERKVVEDIKEYFGFETSKAFFTMEKETGWI